MRTKDRFKTLNKRLLYQNVAAFIAWMMMAVMPELSYSEDYPENLFLQNQTIEDLESFEYIAINTITAGPLFIIEDGGGVTMKAGARVHLKTGFEARRGAFFHAAHLVSTCPNPITITGQPVSVSVKVGSPATFSVTATGNNLSYQWQKNTQLISGATAAIYTTPAATLSDNGAAFRCVIQSTGCQSMTSTSAILTVAGYPSGIIHTVAGTGTGGFNGDNIPAVSAQLNSPYGISIDGSGNLYIADTGNERIRQVNGTGIITTVAGGGTVYTEGALATNVKLTPVDVMMGEGNILYVVDMVDMANNLGAIRAILPDHTIVTIAGGGASPYSISGVPAKSASISPYGMTLDQSTGDIYFVDPIKNVTAVLRQEDGKIYPVTQYCPQCMPALPQDGTLAENALLSGYSLTIDDEGNLFIATGGPVYQIGNNGIVSRIAGCPVDDVEACMESMPAGEASNPLYLPLVAMGVDFDQEGNLYVVSFSSLIKIDQFQSYTLIAGNLSQENESMAVDGGPATAGNLNFAISSALDLQGNFYISEIENHKIRVVGR